MLPPVQLSAVASLPTLRQQVVDDLLHGRPLESEDVAGNDALQGGELPVDFVRYALAFDFVGRQAQPHHAGCGQICQVEVRGQGIFPVGDLFGQHRFGQTCRDQRAVYDLPQGETGFQTRHYLVGHQVLHFEGDARQRNHDLAVLFEPHAGGRAVGVEKHGAARRDERLIAVQAVVFDSACFEHAPHVVGDGLIAYEPGAEELGEGLFRDVVLGGAEAAGQDDYVALVHGPFYGLGDLLALVADRCALPDDDARIVQVTGDRRRIGIHDLPDQDFVADRKNRCFHGGKIELFSRRGRSGGFGRCVVDQGPADLLDQEGPS